MVANSVGSLKGNGAPCKWSDSFKLQIVSTPGSVRDSDLWLFENKSARLVAHLHCFQLFRETSQHPSTLPIHAHMTSTTLPLFWNLSSNTTNERLDASVKLIGTLEIFQSQHVPIPSSGEGSEEDEENEDEETSTGADKLDELNAPDVAYAIRRLVRGLASPRESSRLGFAVALTEVCFTRLQNDVFS